mmetsp:Transcript_23670/g.73966  ORF Transcript_23670/g.73966 Transcript_23670/m.73966 type:complete len:216 (+) Transcript_23670:208-855(+)
MSSVALGRAASDAASPMRFSFVRSASHAASVAPIFRGFLINAPKPLSTTKSTLPASWPGRWDDRRHGKPQQAASAMVPGPALVTIQSAAAIHSSMFSTKPRIVASTPSGHARPSNSAFTSAFFPQTTTTPAFWSDNASPTAFATRPIPPTPSPPPTINAVGRSGSRPSVSLSSALDRASFSQKPSRSGRPRRRILSSSRPQRFAMVSSAGDGTNV